ncbi:MAG TPA: 4-hydroxy-3-methylbut-2-enyl diphosphate reductase [Dehalococcoidales bacterium]
MPRIIRTTQEIGFCFGVKRAIEMLENAAKKNPQIDTLGPLVHNEQVLDRLSSKGINIVSGPVEIRAPVAAISAHGVGPVIESELAAKSITLIDTTCPDVKRAQKAARELAQNGFWVIVFGDAGHQEVQGILGWADGNGVAALNIDDVKKLGRLPRRLGLLSQTTQTPDNFAIFAQELVELSLPDAAEIRLVNTICNGVRKRQLEALELAQKSDLMLVIGSRTSANSNRLFKICAPKTETYLINTAADIDPIWLEGKKSVGVTSGTSTSQETIGAVLDKLHNLRQ